MRANDDVDAAVLKVVEHLPGLLCRACARQVVHPYGHTLQTALECLVVLICQHRCGHHHRHLLRVACCLEGGAHRHLGLSESHVAADETVHRARGLHIGLHVVGGFQLVGSVLIEETCLQFVLHERVGRERESPLASSGGIQFYKVARNVLYLLLGALLQSVPRSRSESGEARRLVGVAAAVFAYLV